MIEMGFFDKSCPILYFAVNLSLCNVHTRLLYVLPRDAIG